MEQNPQLTGGSYPLGVRRGLCSPGLPRSRAGQAFSYTLSCSALWAVAAPEASTQKGRSLSTHVS